LLCDTPLSMFGPLPRLSLLSRLYRRGIYPPASPMRSTYPFDLRCSHNGTYLQPEQPLADYIIQDNVIIDVMPRMYGAEASTAVTQKILTYSKTDSLRYQL
jgi:hypothetical protein